MGSTGVGNDNGKVTAPPLPAFLREEEGEAGAGPASAGGGAAAAAARRAEAMPVDPDFERKLWLSIIRESKPVPGRADVFEW